jgi:hypothetical protein
MSDIDRPQGQTSKKPLAWPYRSNGSKEILGLNSYYNILINIIIYGLERLEADVKIIKANGGL